MTILDTIVERTRERIREEKQHCPLTEIRHGQRRLTEAAGKRCRHLSGHCAGRGFPLSVR